MYHQICRYCNHEYESRLEHPKSCPRCKKRWDTPYGQKSAPGKQAAMRWIEFELIRAGVKPSQVKREARLRLDKMLSVRRV